MTAYYNEIDPYAAQWLRNLIAAGHIAPGDVDTRSIEDVQPDDLKRYTQWHFFAGIGVWSYALRRAGWSDDRRIWTMSCPCQPFSAAGEGAGFADERHLWPAAFHLISQCRPARVLGEQVASKDAEPWIDLVQADMEAVEYAFGAVPFPSAGVGAPHIRDRLYWVADARHDHAAGQIQATGVRQPQAVGPADQSGGCGAPPRGVDHADQAGLAGHGRGEAASGGVEHGVRFASGSTGAPGDLGGMADADDRSEHALLRVQPNDSTQDLWGSEAGGPFGHLASRNESQLGGVHGSGTELPGPVNGFWRDADWLFCRDGKWRPVEPGSFPLVDGSAARVGPRRADWYSPAGPEGFGHRAGRLKGYGNAINAEAAVAFIQSLA